MGETMKFIIVSALASFVSLAADPGTRSFFDGNQLLDRCTSSDVIKHGVCIGYIQGVMDTIEAIRYTNKRVACLPVNTTEKQLEDVVLSELQAHPEDRLNEAAGIVIFAVTKAWSCNDR